MTKWKWCFSCLLLVSLTTNIFAQYSVIAYIEVESILQEMPEYKKIANELAVFQGQQVRYLDKKKEEIATFYQDILEAVKNQNLSDKQQAEAQERLQQMQEELEEMKLHIDRGLMVKEKHLSKPMHDKFKAAIRKVAVKYNYHYIIDKKFVLGVSPKAINATKKVKKALGL